MDIGWLDGTLWVVLAFSVALGALRGLIREVVSLAAWVLAFLLAQVHAETVAAWLPAGLSVPVVRLAAGFALIFIGVAVAGALLSWVLGRFLQAVGLRPIDRILGAGFGLARGLVLLLGVTLMVVALGLQSQPVWAQSETAMWLTQTLQELKPLLPGALAEYIP
ncbi:MAG: CvpA family protein [Hydrogenophaga sp.]|jgi:membrane protein required for colicin V production